MREIHPDKPARRKKHLLLLVFSGAVLVVLLAYAGWYYCWGGSSSKADYAAARPVVSLAPVAALPEVMKPADLSKLTLQQLQEASTHGNSLGCFELAERYRLGRGCLRDEEEARRWYEKASSSSDDAAMFMRVAKAYLALEDRKKAETKFEMAAILGSHEAQLWMAHRHERDGDVDLSDTYAWFSVCASWGDPDSIAVKQHMEKVYAPSEIFKGRELARSIAARIQARKAVKGDPSRGELLKKKAYAGDVEAQLELGEAYLTGGYVLRDLTEAERWLKLAADAGSAEACASLARYYEVAFKPDIVMARYYHLKAAMSGHAPAQFSVAERYRYGVNGFTQFNLESYAWFNICAAAGNQEAVGACDLLEAKMTPSQKLDAQKRSRELLAEIEAKKAKK